MQGNISEWFKSSYSGENGACVEACNRSDSGIDLRDSKYPQGPILTFGPEARLSFVTAVKAQELGA
jgi:uncharacterized protein DUF397